MISEAVAAFIAGVFGYMVGDGRGDQRGRLWGRGEAEAEWSRKYDSLKKHLEQKLEEANFQIKLKVYIAAREAFFYKVKGKPFSRFISVYSADFKSHGRDDYSENHINFPAEADAHFYGKSKLTGEFSFADYRVAARPGFPNALVGDGRWLFCGPGGDYDTYVRQKGENNWVPRQEFPPAWIVQGHANYRFETKEEAHLYAGYLKLHSELSPDLVVVLEEEGQPNAVFYGVKIENLM